MPHIGIGLIFQILQFSSVLKHCKYYLGDQTWSRLLRFLESEKTTHQQQQKQSTVGEFPRFSIRDLLSEAASAMQQLVGVQLFCIDPSVFSDALARNVMLFHY